MFRPRKKQFAALAALLIGSFCSGVSLGAAPTTLAWQTNLESAKQLAAQSNRLVLVHFWSPGCVPCKQLEKNVFAQPQVQQTIQARFVPVKINADDWPTTTKQYGITALPTDLIITPSGQIVGRMISPPIPDAYLQQLAVAASGGAPVAAQTPAYAGAVATGANVAAAQAPAAVPTITASGWIPSAPNVPSVPAYSASPTNTATAATTAPNVGWGAATATGSNTTKPAVSAYSDSRYAEYYQKFSTTSAGTNAAVAPGTAAATPGMAAVAPQTAYASAANVPSANAPPYAAPTTSAGTPAYVPPAVYSPQSPYGSPATSAGPTGAPAYGAPSYGTPANSPPAYAPQTGAPVTATAVATSNSPASVVPRSTQPAMQPQTGVAAASSVATAVVPPLALDGYCPVTLVEQQRWQVGDRRWGVIHRGRTYLFTGPEQQRKFLANPDRYSPAISGHDVVLALDHGQEIEGKRAMGVEYQNRIYLFSNDASRQAFSQNPKRYAAEVLQAEAPSQTTLR